MVRQSGHRHGASTMTNKVWKKRLSRYAKASRKYRVHMAGRHDWAMQKALFLG